MLNVNEHFPSFALNGVNLENQMVNVTQEQMLGTWSVVYFYPKDFTFICPTEIQEMDILASEAIVMGVSADNEFCKLAWKHDNKLINNINHTLAADCGLNLADLWCY